MSKQRQEATNTTALCASNLRGNLLGMGAWIGLGAGLLWFVRTGRLSHILRSIHVSYDDAPRPSMQESLQSSLRQHQRMIVNEDQLKGRLRQIKGRIKERWGAMTDDDITQAEGKLEQLAGAIQQKYGGTKAQVLTQLRKLS